MKHLNASHGLIMRLEYPDAPGFLGRIADAIGDVEGSIGSVDVVTVERGLIARDISVGARDVEHGEQISACVRGIPDLTVLSVVERTFLAHEGGKIEVRGRVPVKTRDDLSMVYTPGVARVCQAIHADPDKRFSLTIRKNTVAVVSDGSSTTRIPKGFRARFPMPCEALTSSSACRDPMC